MPSLVEIAPVVLEKKIFLISSMYFCYFVIISPWKRAGAFIWTNLNPFTQGCIMPSLVEICPVVLKKKILKFCQWIRWLFYRIVKSVLDTPFSTLYPYLANIKIQYIQNVWSLQIKPVELIAVLWFFQMLHVYYLCAFYYIFLNIDTISTRWIKQI